MKRILIVKFWALGDILMATPLLRALKRHWPDCHITWIADKDYANILQHNPLIDHLIAFDSATWRRAWRYGLVVTYLRQSLALRRDLKQRSFDIVLNLTAEKWWTIWMLTAPLRIGLFPRAKAGKMARFYAHAIPRGKEPFLHNTQHYLLPADALGIPGPYDERMVLGISDTDRAAVQEFLAAQQGYDPAQPLFLLHPRTSQKSKEWPPDYYARLCAMLTARGACVVLTGSPREQDLCHDIAAQAGGAGVFVAAGKLPSLLATAALVERVSAVVTGDTSLLHIASALDIPLVAIYGSTRPRDNAPLFGRHVLLFDDTVPCAPCYKSRCPLVGTAYLQCQRAVTPEQALAALDTLVPPGEGLPPSGTIAA